jgi:uncharacterized protein YcnI
MNIMKKIITITSLGLMFASIASAHVTVKPGTAGIGAYQVFTVNVPSEKDISTVALKLILPEGLNFVTPTVKPGWKVEVKTTTTSKTITDDDGMEVPEMRPTEILWTGGSVPGHQRDEFTFQTQTPNAPTTLKWKAEQTYSDGSVVSWNQDPGADAKTPYSQTLVVNDLTATSSTDTKKTDTKATVALALAAVALVLSTFAAAKRRQGVN